MLMLWAATVSRTQGKLLSPILVLPPGELIILQLMTWGLGIVGMQQEWEIDVSGVEARVSGELVSFLNVCCPFVLID